MRLLACIDGSRWAYSALQHACRGLEPEDEVVLLTVCPRGGEGYLECGRMALEAALRACSGTLAGKRVRTRLAVGDAREVIPAVAAEERAAVVVMGALGTNGLPYGPELGDTARAARARCDRPLLVGSPRGVELLAGEESLLVSTRRGAAPRFAAASRGRRTAPAGARRADGCEIGHTPDVTSFTPPRGGDGYNEGDFPLSSETPPVRVIVYRPPGRTDRGAVFLARRTCTLLQSLTARDADACPRRRRDTASATPLACEPIGDDPPRRPPALLP
jgi:nucleotide-binding universal stress UspA family protein